jgi:hypothetical protein
LEFRGEGAIRGVALGALVPDDLHQSSSGFHCARKAENSGDHALADYDDQAIGADSKCCIREGRGGIFRLCCQNATQV